MKVQREKKYFLKMVASYRERGLVHRPGEPGTASEQRGGFEMSLQGELGICPIAGRDSA